MTRYYPRRRRSATSRWLGRLLPSLLLVILGSAGFYWSYQWFRQDAEDSAVQAGTESLIETEIVTEVESIENSTQPSTNNLKLAEDSSPLISAYDGQHTGRVLRFLADARAEFSILAYLPAIDLKTEKYQVWLLKDGLSDVKDMGELSIRADGSWVLNIVAAPTTGIADPGAYKGLVIMRALRDDSTGPSGYRIAEARF